MQVIDINPLALPSLPLEKHKQLPKKPCCYFVLSASKVLYIGKAVNLALRWVKHHRYTEFESMANVRIAWFEVKDSSLLQSLESSLIAHFHPPINNSRDKPEPDMATRIRLSVVVKLARGNRSQRKFAKDLGISYAAIRSWEECENLAGLESMKVIATASGMTLEELLAYLKGEIEVNQVIPKAKIAEDLFPFVNVLPREERKRLIQFLVAID